LALGIYLIAYYMKHLAIKKIGQHFFRQLRIVQAIEENLYTHSRSIIGHQTAGAPPE